MLKEKSLYVLFILNLMSSGLCADTFFSAWVQNAAFGNKKTVREIEKALYTVSGDKDQLIKAIADENKLVPELRLITDNITKHLKNAQTYLEALQIPGTWGNPQRKSIDPYNRTAIANIASRAIQKDQFNEVVKIVDKVLHDLGFPDDTVTIERRGTNEKDEQYFYPFHGVRKSDWHIGE